jgi:signal transduction histidine kinase/ActR/RegA family two-component response regulator
MVIVRALLEPTLEDKSPFLLFTFAVMLAATLGGVWVGVAGTAIGAIAGLVFLADTPQGAVEMFRSGRILQVMLYLAVCGGVMYLIDALRHLRHRAEAFAAQQARLADELGQANRAKDEFLATVSHELRTPLTAIVGWAHVLKTGRLTGPQMAKAVETIDRNAHIQTQLIADMLDVARITSGKLRLEPKPVNAADVVAAAVQTVAPAAHARSIELQEDCERDALVWGDPDRLQQVVWNLLSNAVKFTPPGGRVTATLRKVDRDIHINIADTGSGLRSEFIPHVFERFRQDRDGRRSPGLGLGLAIVKNLVEMHGGRVSAGNRSDGSGAEFEVVIPHLSDATAARPDTDPRRDEVTRAQALAGLRVLVVDDEPDARDLLEWMLKDLGADVVTVGSVRDAMADLSRRRPDVILTDITMPGEDGYSLLQKVLAAVGTRSALPIAAISASATPAERARALEAGFATHLAKPVRPDALANAILSLTHMTHH